jgi:hypothetical protein
VGGAQAPQGGGAEEVVVTAAGDGPLEEAAPAEEVVDLAP